MLFAIATTRVSLGKGGGEVGQTKTETNMLKQARLRMMGVMSLACVLMDVPMAVV